MCISLLIIISTSGYSQHTTTPSPMTQSDYLVKAKKQNTAACFLLVVGFGLSTAGIIAGTQEFRNTIDEFSSFFTVETKRSSAGAGAILLITGGATMLSSIPFFVSASENRKKAADAPVSLKFKMETQPFIRQGSLVKTAFPAISLRIGF